MSPAELSRRTLVAGVASVASAAAVVTSARVAQAIISAEDRPMDPIFGAIETHRKSAAEWDAEYDALDEMEGMIEERRPHALIAWGNRSHIGSDGIERMREEFLAEPDADPVLIKKEYRSAKARYRAKLLAGRKWDERHGLTALRKKVEGLKHEVELAGERLSKVKPTSVAGCAALVTYARADLEIGQGPEWPLPALANAAVALESIAAAEAQPG